ncbi:MAG: hypothetical protein ACKO7W_08645 [Elainella sp.]
MDGANAPIEVLEGIERRCVRLRPLPTPDVLEYSLPQATCLVTDNGSVTTLKLVQALLEKGWRVTVLSFPPELLPQQVPLPPGVRRVILADLTEAHLQQRLAEIAADGPIGAFIHLHPRFAAEGLAFLEADRAIVKQVFFIAKHLKQTLSQTAHSGFYTVTHLDGAFGFDHDHSFTAIPAGLFGLTKTLAMEWPTVACRALDLSPSLDADQITACILAELHDPDRSVTEVAYGAKGRVTLTV